MDPLYFTIAVAPLAVYLALVAILNLAGRPFVTTGARDAAALGIGVSGLIIAGPMELFFPEAAASQFGSFVWILLVCFYGLCVSLIVLLLRSRIVIYNITSEQLRPILNQISNELDRKSRWVGDSLIIPDLKIHLNHETINLLRNAQLIAIGKNQSIEGWRKFELELKKALRPIRVGPNLIGLAFLIVAGCLAATSAVWLLAADPQSVAQSLRELLRQ